MISLGALLTCSFNVWISAHLYLLFFFNDLNLSCKGDNMTLTLNDVLTFEIMESARVRTGKKFLDQRYVQWISVIEMPVENFVRKNEAVLSTAIGCGQDLELFKKFVQDIIESEASALMIALGRHIFQIPQEVIALAEEKNFVIIEIPWEVRFANIIEDVMKELNGIQYKDRERSEQVQQELLKLILKNSDINTISRFIQKQIGCPIMLIDRKGVMLDQNSHRQSFIDQWKFLMMRENSPIKSPSSVAMHDPMFSKFQIFEIDEQIIVQMPILQGLGDAQGYLIVMLPPHITINDFLTQYRINVLEHSSTTIALWLSRKNAIENTKMSLRSDFVQELAKGDIHNWNQANSRAKLLGYNLKVPYVCIVGFAENLKTLFQKRKHDYATFGNWLDNMIRYIEEEILYAAQSLKREVMLTYQEERLLIFLEISGDKGNVNPSDFLDLVERRLRNLIPEVVISWGISNPLNTLDGFHKSYENAKVALEIGRSKKGIGYRMMYEHTQVDRLLLNLAKNNEMKTVILSTIEPLIRYDEQHHMDLIDTFSAYNDCHRNVSKTARMLNLHRQSLLYRLRKIEALTGLSLNDTDDLFLLDLSIKTWKMGLAKAK